jgi:hypothetical protein
MENASQNRLLVNPYPSVGWTALPWRDVRHGHVSGPRRPRDAQAAMIRLVKVRADNG